MASGLRNQSNGWQDSLTVSNNLHGAMLDASASSSDGYIEGSMWEIKRLVSKGEYNYAVVDNHPFATKQGYVLHHRVVMENHLGRILVKDEVVHHINHNKKDNRIENLALMDDISHKRRHGRELGRKYVHLRCPECDVEFCKAYNLTHLQIAKSYTCCSARCRGRFSRRIQLQGLTAESAKSIESNVLAVFTRFVTQ